MTGFGEAVTETDICRLEVRIRSVNHRYLDLVVRLPDELRDRESEIRELVASRLLRGRIEVRLDMEDRRERRVQARVDTAVVVALRKVADDLKHAGLPLAEVRLGDLLRLPEAIRFTLEPPRATSAFHRQLSSTLDEALTAIERARDTEGEKLRSVLEQRLDALDGLLEQIAQRRIEVQQELDSRARQRLTELLADAASADEGRLSMELALLAQRADVQEELDRLAGHGEHLRQVLADAGAIGKRLDFLAQEIFRELSTLAAKCRHTDVVKLAIEAKVTCEQLREQIQNVE